MGATSHVLTQKPQACPPSVCGCTRLSVRGVGLKEEPGPWPLLSLGCHGAGGRRGGTSARSQAESCWLSHPEIQASQNFLRPRPQTFRSERGRPGPGMCEVSRPRSRGSWGFFPLLSRAASRSTVACSLGSIPWLTPTPGELVGPGRWRSRPQDNVAGCSAWGQQGERCPQAASSGAPSQLRSWRGLPRGQAVPVSPPTGSLPHCLPASITPRGPSRGPGHGVLGPAEEPPLPRPLTPGLSPAARASLPLGTGRSQAVVWLRPDPKCEGSAWHPA